MASFKQLSDSAWVRLAASTDKARPVLTCLRVDDGNIAATDGHRLHIAAVNMDEGYQVGTWEELGRVTASKLNNKGYPDYWPVVSMIKAVGVPRVIAPPAIPLLKAAIVRGKESHSFSDSMVSFPLSTGEGHIHLNALYVLEAIAGRCSHSTKTGKGMFEVQDPCMYFASSPLSPVLFVVHGLHRIAIVMPVRQGMAQPYGPDKHFDLSEYTEPWEKWTGMEVPEATLPEAEIQTPGGSSEEKENATKE